MSALNISPRLPLYAYITVLFVLAASMDGRTLYVSSVGDDANSGTERSRAWKTPQKAADESKPGDTVFFVGTFEVTKEPVLSIRKSGTEDAPIRFMAAESGAATFESRVASHAILLVGVSHIVVEGFRIHGGAGDTSEALALSLMNDIKDNRVVGNGVGVVADETAGVPSHSIVVRGCTISDFPGGGLYMVHSDRVLFEDNVVFNCAFWSPYANSAISIYQPVDVDADRNSYKICIQRNVCYRNMNYIPFFYSDPDPQKRSITDGNGIILDDFNGTQGFGGGKGEPYQGRTLIANNIVFENGGSGIHTFLSRNVDIVHNLAFANNAGTKQNANGQIYASHSSFIRIFNNILMAPVGKPVNTDWNNEEGVDYDHNVYTTTTNEPPPFAREPKSNIFGVLGMSWGDWTVLGGRTVTISEASAAKIGGREFPGVVTDFFGNRFPETGPRPAGPFAESHESPGRKLP